MSLHGHFKVDHTCPLSPVLVSVSNYLSELWIASYALSTVRILSVLPVAVYLTSHRSLYGTEALDTNSNKSAILACNKLLKKQPNNLLVKVRTVFVGRITCCNLRDGVGSESAGTCALPKGRGGPHSM